MSEQQRIEAFVSRVLSDTGFLCRELLGYNYDEDGPGGKHINVGTGGIVEHGKTQEIVELLDNDLIKFKLVEAPRESRKSTIAQGFVVRHILRNPDIRIAYVARTDKMASDKAIAVRNQLERDEVTQLFGDQRGPVWTDTYFTVAGRKEKGLQNPTFQVFSMDSMPTGGRWNILVLDDFIDDSNCTNAEQIRKSKDKYARLQPFIAKGGLLVVFGTRWDELDLYADLEASPLFAPPEGGQVVCGAGVTVHVDQEGKFSLLEDPTGITFPHLTLPYLTQKLHGMLREGKAHMFYHQYLNQASGRSSSLFKRSQFQPLEWGDDMKQLSGYLLTDTATGEDADTCYSVVAYVGLDASDNIYLLDLRVGHIDPVQYCDTFFDVLEAWQPKVNHCGEVWEGIALVDVFLAAIEGDSRARKTRLRPIKVPRNASTRKATRIQRLYMPFYNKRFWVVNTVPTSFIDVDGPKELWNPEGFFDARTKTRQPSGELVEEFLRTSGKRDIPDALALIHEFSADKQGHNKRFCTFKPWRPKPTAQSLTERRKHDYHAQEYPPAMTDWWERTLHDHGI